MRKFAFVSLVALLFTAALANAQCGDFCGFYGGDFDPNNPNANALANETDAIVGDSPYGAAVYQNFTSGGGTISALFSNNLSNLNPSTGYWEIRTGVSEGNGGTLIASGTGLIAQTPTGRSGLGFTEYRDEIGGLGVTMTQNVEYWMAVVPNDPNNANRSFNSNTFGANGYGFQQSDQQFWNSAFFGANFINADTQGVFETFSSGMRLWQPEPSTIIMFGSGLLAVAGVVRRRLGR